ncbi:putative zinc finger protein 840 [Thrips palmi]|uniref:Zinc finger protein 840 n=1 Tax=Thrips palmi TaxID=161013 RepID=A0A6P8ZNT3_THRPL|nr:putative zinc finger protein 840 [Thrips palmi]
MILVSYIDILDFVGGDRLCLIEGEEIFNDNKVANVEVLCRSAGECYDVSATCQDTSHSKNVTVCIKIDENKKKSFLSNCTCVRSGLGKCGHVAAILIYLHRNPLSCSNDSDAAQLPPKSQFELKNSERKIDNNSLKEDHIGKRPEEQYCRKLRNKRPIAAVGTTSRGETKSKSVINKTTNLDNVKAIEDVDDPTWVKESDGEDDEAIDFSPSSDDDWKPSPEKKRQKRKISLCSSKDPKGVSKAREKKHHMTILKEDQEARELSSSAFQGCEGEEQKEDEDKADDTSTRTESQKKSLAVSAPFEEEEEEDSNLTMEPLQCLLCEVATGTRQEMHGHYILAHRTKNRDTVVVCDRCGDFRLPRDHICPSQQSFRCRMCRVSFQSGRFYWNHLIRVSKTHTARLERGEQGAQGAQGAQGGLPRWRCGWSRCAERFPTEEELMIHVRLHLPQPVAHMCTVCNLLLPNADAKVLHLAKHDSSVYECAACAHACADKEALRQHWQVHANERPHLCDQCGWRFVSEDLLQVHARKVHEGGPFSCNKCPTTFNDRTDLRVHFGAAHGKVRCWQSSCTFRCTRKASLQRHERQVHRAHANAAEDDVDVDFNVDDPPPPPETVLADASGDDSSLTCPVPACGASFAKRGKLRDHVRDVHDGAPVICPECNKAFRTRRALDEHVRVHTGERPFVCAECGMSFKRVQNLEYHIKGAHKNERNFSCPECDKRYISNADMQRHLRYSHQDSRKWHLCTECGHKAPSLFNLKQHVQSKHTGERPHKCYICQAGFVAKSDLTKHIMYKHDKQQPFPCPDCDRRYQRRRDLQLHQQRHHATGHTCPECGKAFDSYASMMQHARYHTNEEAFQCAACGRRFPHRMNLSRHLCTPDIKKNFRCKTCGLTFTTSGSLKSHRRRLHPTEYAADLAEPTAKQAKQDQQNQDQEHQDQEHQDQEHQDREQQQQQESQTVEQPSEDQQPPPPPSEEPPPEQPQPVAQTPQTSSPQYLPPPAAQSPVIHHASLNQQPHQQPPQQPQTPQPVTQLAAHEAAQQSRQHVVVHQPRHHQEEQQHADQQPQQHAALGEAHGAWVMQPAGAATATTAALTQDDAILTLTTCPTYHDPESAPPPLVLQPLQQSNVLRYSALPTDVPLVVKAPPPLVSLQVKADQQQVMYAQPAVPTGTLVSAAPTVKLVSVSQSQPPPLASLSSSGQILGAPIQSTADGSIHLVFVPAPTVPAVPAVPAHTK